MDFEGTFHALKDIGFCSVEPMVVFPQAQGADPVSMEQKLYMARQDGAFWVSHAAKERIKWLRTEGFQVQGIQLGLVGMTPGGLDTLLPFVLNFSEGNALSYVVHSPQKKTIADIQVDVNAFRKGLTTLKDNGTELLFHCHYHEFMEDQEDTPFSYLLREVPMLRVELDVGWVHFAKRDVIEIMERYRNRIAIIHLKDIAPDASEKNHNDCFTAIGEGSIPLDRIIQMADELKLSYTGLIVDQDASRGDMLTDLRNGFRNIQNSGR